MKRRGKLTEKRSELELDNTAYELTNVTNPGGTVKLRVEAPRGVPSAIALIGRRGPSRGGEVTVESRFLSAGGSASVKLANASGFERVTAAVINADGQQGRAPTERAARLPRQADEVGRRSGRGRLRPGCR